MKKLLKRLALGILTLAVLCTAIPAAFAADNETGSTERVEVGILTIELDAQGGIGSELTVLTNRYGQLTALPTQPTLDGYRFLGWYDEPIGGNKITTDSPFNTDTTIYAQWEVKGTTTLKPTAPVETPDNTQSTSFFGRLTDHLGTLLIAGITGIVFAAMFISGT